MNDDRVGLLTIIRARRKWYLGVYFIQLVLWLGIMIINELFYTPALAADGSTIPLIERVIRVSVNMSFLAQGNLVATVFWIDIVFDGFRNLLIKGVEGLGLIFSPIKNRFAVEGERIGEKKGRKEALRSLSKQIEDNPHLDIKEVIEKALMEDDQRNRR